MQPLLKRYINRYRGPANSQEYNELRDHLHFDITRLYDYTAQHDVRIRKHMDILMAENYFMQSRMMELEQLLDDIQESISGGGTLRHLGATYGTHRQVLYSIPGTDINIGMNDRLEIDTLHRVAALPATFSQSRVTFSDITGNKLIPANLQAHVYEGVSLVQLEENMNNSVTINNTSLYNMFDGNRANFWSHRSTQSNSTDNVYVAVHIKLPSVDLINQISLHPFPEFSLSLLDIKYRNPSEPWQTVSTYPVEEEETVIFDNITKLKFVFPAVHADEIIIYLRQPNWFVDGDNHLFMYGMQAVDIQYNEYPSTGASVVSEFDLAQLGALKFKSVTHPRVRTGIGSVSNIDNLLDHALYYEDDQGNVWPGSFNTTIPLESNCAKVYILTTMRPKDNITPTLNALQLAFEVY